MSGVNFCAALMLPFIFSLPLHSQTSTIQSKQSSKKAMNQVQSIGVCLVGSQFSPNERHLRVQLAAGDGEEVIVREGEGRVGLPLVRP